MKQPLWKWKFLTFLLLILFSCQKDDALKPEEASHPHPEEHHIQKVSSQDIPKVMDFLKGKNNGQLRFKIQASNGEGIQTKSSEPDLILTDLETENILALTDEAGRTNYSFQLTFENAPQYEGEVSIFNLIVKEINTEEGFYGYIQEYRMSNDWYRENGFDTDFTDYDGKMVIYTMGGLYVSVLEIENGYVNHAHYRSPCPDEGSGSGDNSGPGPGGDGGGTGGTGGTGGGTGGFNITVDYICGCNPGHVGGSSNPKCDCTLADIPVGFNIGIRSMEGWILNELRSPCPPMSDAPNNCYDQYNDPCPFGCNPEGGCAEENEEIAINPPTYNLLLVLGLNSYLDTDLTIDQTAWIHASIENYDIAWEVHDDLVDNPDEGQYNFSILATEKKITTNLNDCTEHLMNDILGLQQANFKEILQQFGSFITPYSWDVSHGIPTGNNYAEADWVRIGGNAIPFEYETIINQSYTNSATEISILRTLLHELLHVYLLSIVDNAVEIPNNSDFYNFPLLWDAIYNNEYDNDPNALHHEIFSEHFINPIKEALKEWDNATQSDQYYEDLAWGGLMGNSNNATSSFDILFPIGSTNRVRIIDTNKAEDTNSTQGNAVPQGDPCN